MTSRTKSDTSTADPQNNHGTATPEKSPDNPFSTLSVPNLRNDLTNPPSSETLTATTKPVVKEIGQDISESLPAGIELHRLYRYQIPLAKDSCDLIVLKLNVPDAMEHKLSEWRAAIALRHPSTEIFINRIEVQENLQANLLNQFRGTDIIRSDGIPTIETMIDKICGEKPPASTPPRAERVTREDLTDIPFVAIDRPDTLDQEDLVYGEKKANGSLMLRAAFIDITDEIVPGSPRDKFSQKVGPTLYGRNRMISPLGPELARGAASFRCGEVRPAWVVECKIHPEKPASEYFKIRRGFVKNHSNIDPSKPFDPNSNKDIAKNLSALAEITRILAHRRTRRALFIRIDGQGAASQIVAETMIHSKRLLAQYLSKHSPTGVIYRVHQKPTQQMIDDCLRELTALKVTGSNEIFEKPTAFRQVLNALERNGSHRAHALANEVLDILLFRTLFSTHNIRHFGLGNIDYLEIKPRAGGIPNQFILDAIFTGRKPPSVEDLNRRAKDFNKKRWTRDERMYTLRFLEMLNERLPETGHIFLAQVARIGGDTMYCDVESFPKWGVVKELPAARLGPGEVVALQLKGFNPKEMRFEFAVVDY